jgi:hypothetical protein
MTRLELIQRVRKYTRDLSNSIFATSDITSYINEGIERFAQVVPELSGLTSLDSDSSSPSLIPSAYQHLIAIYAASRCFFMDEREYKASTMMNEFEVKLDEMKAKIEAGEITIVDENGDEVTNDYDLDYVDLTAYWDNTGDGQDLDEGVDGL